MVANVNYWYNEQIRNIIKQVSRVFSHIYISSGTTDGCECKSLRRVPITYMSTDKSVWSLLTKNTDTIVESAPRMVFTISKVSLNNEKQVGPALEQYKTSFTEKKWNETDGNYNYEIGNSYNITRLNPVPLGLTIKLYILTTLQSSKLQIFEQLRGLFYPSMEFQTSENPFDWTRISAIRAVDVNWTSKGDSDLDSSTLDVMDMSFQIDTNFDYPSLIQKERIIEEINTDIGLGNKIEDVLSWEFDDVLRSSFSPTNNNIKIEENKYVTLLPSKKCTTWYELFDIYGIDYNASLNNISLKVFTDPDFENSKYISGTITINNLNSSVADWTINTDTLPSSTVEAIDAIVNPRDITPSTTTGTRYLILQDIENNTQFWGSNFYDTTGAEITKFKSQSIIQKVTGGWKLMLDPSTSTTTQYVFDKSNSQYLYTYNKEVGIWVDYINKNLVPTGHWRIEVIEN